MKKRYVITVIFIVILLIIQMYGNKLVASEQKNDIKRVEWDTEHMTDLEKAVQDIATYHLRVGDPSKVEQLKSYAIQHNISVDKINNFLMGYIRNGLEAPPDNMEANYLFDFSIGAVGDLRYIEALPLLKEIAFIDNPNTDRTINRRRSAVRSIVKIGGEGLIDFARQVLVDNNYSDLDRHALYEELSKYVKGDTPLDDKELQNSVKQFLLTAINKESDGGNVMRLDKLLSGISGDYRVSYQRENILKKFEGSNVNRHSKYFSEKLKELKETPKTKRTKINIRD